MENIILVVHMILALCLIGVVLLQRSEGGGLGIGGGSGGGGVMSGRSAASALAKLTWLFAIGFLVTSISLTILAAKNSAGDSVIERLGAEETQGDVPAPAGLEGSLLPPTTDDAPTAPPKAD